jgi:hypothetical protein
MQDTFQTEADMCEAAINLQDACNGAGVANTLAKMYRTVLRVSGSTDRANTDPAVKLTLFKLMDLAGCAVDFENYSAAWTACQNVVAARDAK